MDSMNGFHSSTARANGQMTGFATVQAFGPSPSGRLTNLPDLEAMLVEKLKRLAVLAEVAEGIVDRVHGPQIRQGDVNAASDKPMAIDGALGRIGQVLRSFNWEADRIETALQRLAGLA